MTGRTRAVRDLQRLVPCLLLALLASGCQTVQPDSDESDPLGRWIDAESPSDPIKENAFGRAIDRL